ncbi:MAG: TonB-dependent receptor [Croceitalea sp.]|nr:TonB-dependent receptor [Croceitalea sp.]
MRFLFTFLFIGLVSLSHAQYTVNIYGKVYDAQTNKPIEGALITIEATSSQTLTGTDGSFTLSTNLNAEQIVKISFIDYTAISMSIIIENQNIDLGTILMEPDILIEKTNNLITLTDADLSDDDETISLSAGLLQATRDVFLNRAAFDFGQAFFRVRGYDSREGQVLLNGILMNKFYDGRPQWNNWGGLNDVIRNQQFTNSLAANTYTFGGILGNTNIDMRPSKMRPGIRLSSSASNRTYTGRVMATYSSGVNQKGWAFTLSGSRRWAPEGYIKGTLYDAFSFFGSAELQITENHSLAFTSILAKNRRGRSSAITQEVFELAGNRYNPYWGTQDGKIRNARERKVFEPILMLNHFYKSTKVNVTSGISYQFGNSARSRLGYFNAPNPDPTYYRYLPSFYINNSIGADFTNAALAREGFKTNPQLSWRNFYTANKNQLNNGKASYVLYDDSTADDLLMVSSNVNYRITDNFSADFGLTYRQLNSHNYAKINDLLGAEYHEDIDPFSDTLNDVNGSSTKFKDAIFNYNYELNATSLNTFVQLNANFNRYQAFLAGLYSKSSFQRLGLFQNERFLNSLGNSDEVPFGNFGLKGGVSYKFSGRHWLQVQGASISRAPLLQNIFINPRENNDIIPNISQEKVTSIDLNYFLRLPDVTGRISGFYTRFQNTTDINFFFVNAGVGSDFVQEVLTDLDKLHMGIELGLEYKASPSVKLSAVVNVGQYQYASEPNVTINFDTAGPEEDLIDPKGNIDLGIANIKDLKLAQGPQKAMAFGIEYRAPKYWWVGATGNYLANNYANISTITRTESFTLNPETGLPFVDATPENVTKLLQQSKLDDFYLLNLVGGKSWLKNGRYISVFASINNVFDAVFRTGGYEQSRNGNFGQLQQDNLRDNPSFAPKYWYGFGRTFFLNLAISF